MISEIWGNDMGGYRSGRRRGTPRKDTVEDCWSLDINWLTREGVFDCCGVRTGTVHWFGSYNGEEISRIGYKVCVPEGWIRLQYTLTDMAESFDYQIRLTETALPWGGARRWFSCPLVHEGQYCNRRVGVLYLGPEGRYYGCRHCYDLTYRSCRESHKTDPFWGEYGLSPTETRHVTDQAARSDQHREQRRRRRKLMGWS